MTEHPLSSQSSRKKVGSIVPNLKQLAKLPRSRSVFLLACLVLNGCVTEQIQDARTCAVAGNLSGGGICSHLIGSETNDLTFKEMLDFLSPQKARTCVPVPGMSVCAEDQSKGTPVALKSRGAALALSSDDAYTMLTEVAVMCRMLGRRCSLATKQVINNLLKASMQ